MRQLLVLSILFSSIAAATVGVTSYVIKSDELLKEFLLSCDLSAKPSKEKFIDQYMVFYKSRTADSFFSIHNYIDPQLSLLTHCDQVKLSRYRETEKKEYFKVANNKLDSIWNDLEKTRRLHLNPSFYLSKYNKYLEKSKLGYSDYEGPARSKYDQYLNEASAIAKKREVTCTPVMNLKAPLSLTKPHRQSPLGWCYAFALSDLIANETKINVSPIYTALLTNNQFLYKLFSIYEGGNLDDALGEIKKNGYCDDKFSSQILTTVKNLEAPINDCDAVTCKEETVEEANQPPLFLLKKFLENSTSLKLKKIVEEVCPIKKNNPYISALRLEKLFVSPSIEFNDRSKNQQNVLWSKLDEQLSAGKILGVNLISDLLVTSNAKRDNGYDHAMTIVGRRFNPQNGSCEYLFRDSIGESCSRYSSDYECAHGHTWIPEDVAKVRSSINGLFYFK